MRSTRYPSGEIRSPINISYGTGGWMREETTKSPAKTRTTPALTAEQLESIQPKNVASMIEKNYERQLQLQHDEWQLMYDTDMSALAQENQRLQHLVQRLTQDKQGLEKELTAATQHAESVHQKLIQLQTNFDLLHARMNSTHVISPQIGPAPLPLSAHLLSPMIRRSNSFTRPSDGPAMLNESILNESVRSDHDGSRSNPARITWKKPSLRPSRSSSNAGSKPAILSPRMKSLLASFTQPPILPADSNQAASINPSPTIISSTSSAAAVPIPRMNFLSAATDSGGIFSPGAHVAGSRHGAASGASGVASSIVGQWRFQR